MSYFVCYIVFSGYSLIFLCILFFFFYLSGDHRDLHVRTHSFPTRRSSDLLTTPINILVSEVGPRDGLQNVEAIMPIAARKAWIDAEAAAGVREIEVGSFVPAKLLPQLEGTAEVVAHARTITGLTVAALVPNARGARDAIAAGAHKITLPLSVSETHSLRNLRRTHEQVLAEAAEIADMIRDLPADHRPHFEGSLSTQIGRAHV